MKFKIITFGCRLNQAESDQISADLIMAGFQICFVKTFSDLIILNVCAVTHKAVREGRQKVAQLKRKYPGSKIIITGCFQHQDWPGVDIWIANQDKENIVSIIQDNLNIKTKFIQSKINTTDRTRAFVKIQTGCDNFCAYCIVPFMRGLPHSRGVEEIIKDIQNKANQGFQEVVLTGVNIGLYNFQVPIPSTRDNFQNKTKFQITNPKTISNIQHSISKPPHKNKFVDLELTGLLRIILENTNVPRIRLSSLWPTHLTTQLINLMAKEPRICPHIHLSIQSGSDKILKFMGRSYTIKDIVKITNQAKSKVSRLNFTSDLIVGFPGETDSDFEASCKLVEKISFSKVHVFKYSQRPQTKAAKMSAQVDERTKQTRSRQLIEQVKERAKLIKDGFLGQSFDVLWEEKKAGFWYGFTDNYLRVKKKVGQKDLKNKIERIQLSKSLLAY